MSDRVACPSCGTELNIGQLLDSEDAQRAFNRLMAVNVPLGGLVLRYINMFAPPKTRLTIAKQVKHLEKLLPDLEREGINAQGREWNVPLKHWANAIDQMLEARRAGKLDLPLTNNRYLYTVLVGLADKDEAAAEKQREEQRRHGTPPDGPATATMVRGQLVNAAEAAAARLAGKDPALLKLDADARNAAPMPDSLRAQIAAMRGGRGKA